MDVAVVICGNDKVLELGIAAHLRGRREVRLLDSIDIDAAQVAVAVTDEVGEATLRMVRAIQRNGCPRVVLVSTRLADDDVLAAVEAGACGLLRTTEVTPERLTEAVVAASVGKGSLPSDLLGPFLNRVGHLQRSGPLSSRQGAPHLSEREIDVLRLVADGHDTASIAEALHYSERTIKGVLHGLTNRLQLRNRTHAVAFAMREGLI